MVRTIGVAALLLTVTTACSDSSGPEDFSPVDTQQKADLVLSAFESNEGLLSLALVGAALDFGGAPLAVAMAPVEPSAFGVATAARLRRLTGGPAFEASAALAIFPVDLLGATFVYDPDTQRYVEDPDATGAPADGVRITLYALNPVTFQVILPLDPVGYLDIIDESTASADALHLIAVVNGVTNLDYVASATTGTTSITLNADGYVSNGTDRVDFDLTFGLTQSAVTVDYLLENQDGAIHLEATITGPQSRDLTLTIDDGDNTVVLEAAITPSTVTGSITYNGDEVVVISGDGEDDVVFERPDGTPLTTAEVAALAHLGDVIDDLFDAFDILLAPAIVAFALG